jgi:hypothetical protein
MKLFIILLFIFNTTWALSDRALFSINENVYYSSDVNSLFRVFKNGFCRAKLPFLNELLKRDDHGLKISTKSGELDSNQITDIEKIISFYKLVFMAKDIIVIPSEEATISACALGQRLKILKSTTALTHNIVKVEKYLQDRLVKKGLSRDQARKKLNKFLADFVSKTSHRTFY